MMIKLWRRLSCILLLITPLAIAGPKADTWSQWDKSNETNIERIDHSAWQRFLDKYLIIQNNPPNLVKYKAVSTHDKKALFEYLRTLAQIDIREYQKTEQAAYWLNLYNALVINLILEHYPVSSIRKIHLKSAFINPGPWHENLIRVNKTNVSLNDIEHRIIRPIFQDPRMHYAITRATLGDPSLSQIAYTRDNLESQLNQLAKRYINSPHGVKFKNDKLQVSKLYRRFQHDFGEQEGAVLTHINDFINPDRKAQFSQARKIDQYFYNWQLNEAK